jgi:hypothetical protein
MNRLKAKLITPLLAIAMFAGAGAGVAALASAQTATDTTSTSPAAATTNTAGVTQNHPMGHAPLGGDGNVTAINGTIITMQEEADEGGASYTVDTSGATVTKDGATAALSDIQTGDKIFVQGTTSGTNVTATSISLGHPGWGHRGEDPNGQ